MLLAEDDPDLRSMYTIWLGTAGFDVLAAADGAEALELWDHADADPPALVLTDWMMPFIDGVELARRIRAHPANGKVPIIVLSAFPEPPTVELAELQLHFRSKTEPWSELAPLLAQLIA